MHKYKEWDTVLKLNICKLSEEGQQHIMGHQLTFLPGFLCQLITRSPDTMVAKETFSHNLNCEKWLKMDKQRNH